MKPTISVCIATYKRPELLKKLLLSLLTQQTAKEFSFVIIVADNDVNRSAESVINELNAGGQNIIYDTEPEQNISLARNKALSHATGDYIAVTDDDEYADSQWLIQLYRTITRYDADVVHGRVIPEFDSKTPEYIKACGVFNQPNPPTGSTDKYVFTTANALFARKLIDGITVPFDPAFGKTGGGDTVFFEKLKKQGCKQVWCREAVLYEAIRAERANLRWIFQREFRRGNAYYRIYEHGPVDQQRSRGAKIRFLAKKAAKLCSLLPFYFIRGFFDTRFANKAIEKLRRSAFYTGMIAYFLGFQYEEYRGR